MYMNLLFETSPGWRGFFKLNFVGATELQCIYYLCRILISRPPRVFRRFKRRSCCPSKRLAQFNFMKYIIGLKPRTSFHVLWAIWNDNIQSTKVIQNLCGRKYVQIFCQQYTCWWFSFVSCSGICRHSDQQIWVSCVHIIYMGLPEPDINDISPGEKPAPATARVSMWTSQ